MKKVIEMAREAGWKDLRDYDSEMRNDFFMGNTDSLARFAELVRADEREACAKVAETYEEWCGPWGQDDNLYAATESANEIAKAIRARGQA